MEPPGVLGTVLQLLGSYLLATVIVGGLHGRGWW